MDSFTVKVIIVFSSLICALLVFGVCSEIVMRRRLKRLREEHTAKLNEEIQRRNAVRAITKR